MIKRVLLFLLTNIAIVLTISLVLHILGVRPYLTQQGLDYQALLIFCLVWGFAGSFISLALSRIMAKAMLGVRAVRPGDNSRDQWVYNLVEQLAKGANLPRTPEVGIYESPEVNAFATGPTKSRALVAFSRGLLASMSRDEIEAVAAHEISHIANGDMVTMTLIQGVVNSFVLFFARVVGYLVSQSVREENARMVQFLVTFLLDIVLGLLGLLVVLWFSRRREFRADYGSAKLVGPSRMISALQALAQNHDLAQVGSPQKSLATLKISSPASGFGRLFMSHPPIPERIEALKKLA